MSAPLSTTHFPRIVTVSGSRFRVTRCDTNDICFDRVTALGTTPETYRTDFPAQAVLPIAGFNPATATEWPTDAALIAAIAAGI